MMKCGHAANSERLLNDGTRIPSCVICAGIPGREGTTIDENPPTLEGRTSRCSYYKPNFKCPDPACTKDHCPATRHERHGGRYPSVAPSSASLPFFVRQDDKPFDQHFCGCWGWD